LQYVRTLRTPSSERFILRRGERDLAALDIHYLAADKVDSTLVLFEDSGIGEEQVPQVLAEIDEAMLPNVSLAEKNLVFTVVVGRVLGAFTADE
jgi:hypothetical protein